jgi:murein DD-endopeptidase MepM/ murein hydrolase activator NlpD
VFVPNRAPHRVPRVADRRGSIDESLRSIANRLAPARAAVVVAGLLVGSVTASVIAERPAAATPGGDPHGAATLRFIPVLVDAPRSTVVPPSIDHPSRSSIPAASPEPESRPQPPTIVRFRPRHGSTGASPNAPVSVRFSTAMDHRSAEAAFRVLANGRAVSGRLRWAEGDTVLVLAPATPLAWGARVQLTVEAGARSSTGLALSSPSSVTFTVAREPPPAPPPTPRPASPKTSAATQASTWRWPHGGPITQFFGQSLTRWGYHYGIDIDGSTGDRIRAARAGRVVVAGRYDGCGGLEVHIDHGDGLVSWYRHLSRVDVRVGARVAAGTVIGRMGATGCVTGSHLHFAIRRGTTFLDPLRFLPPR